MGHVQQRADSETSLNQQLDIKRQSHCVFHLESYVDIARILTCLLGLKKHCEQFRIYQDLALSIDEKKQGQQSGENDIN